jgi:hypothetical protein
LREEDDTDTNFIASFDSIVSDQGFNNLRFSITREDVSFANPGFNEGGQTFETQRGLDVSELHPGVLDGASDVAQSRVNQSYQLDDTFSLFVPGMGGGHNMKFGVNYSYRTETFSNFGTAKDSSFDTDQPWIRTTSRDLPRVLQSPGGGLSGDPAGCDSANDVYGLSTRTPEDFEPADFESGA